MRAVGSRAWSSSARLRLCHRQRIRDCGLLAAVAGRHILLLCSACGSMARRDGTVLAAPIIARLRPGGYVTQRILVHKHGWLLHVLRLLLHLLRLR